MTWKSSLARGKLRTVQSKFASLGYDFLVSSVLDSEGSFGRQWREGMVQLGLEMVDNNGTDIGVFLGN